MDYIGNKCPVCDKYFHIGDDIVVCPECGTPHHRECYQNNGGCANADRHKDGFDYQEDIKQSINHNESKGIECKKCGTKNSEDAFFCTKCGNSLHEDRANTNTQNAQAPKEQPFGNTQFGGNPNVMIFDPLAGVSPSADLGDQITAGEYAKYVKQNTPYFITVFNNIKKFSKSRFNFCAMFFGGGYLLFRKMYKVGAIITAIQTALTIIYLYLNYYIASNNAYDKLFEASSQNDYNAFLLYYSELSDKDLYFILLFMMIAFITLVLDIVIGACANRMYYNHCRKEIAKIKSEAIEPAKVGETLSKKGGVNAPLALSLWFTYIVISYLPQFFS
ncbi:MAG: DUF2628 domain-containing protein [Ruminococcus sp.]|nr:DUF2628 domain-containing protein [Ruminococcus sp.]